MDVKRKAVAAMELHDAVRGLVWGHALMAACAVSYLAWWAIFFRPGAHVAGGLAYAIGVLCILVAAFAGISGAVLICRGVSIAGTGVQAEPPFFAYLIGGVIAYLALAAFTSMVLHRPVTTELMLIVAWGTMELAVCVALGASGMMPTGGARLLAALVVALVIASLVCYVLYYQLSALPSFVDGMAPLAAVGIESVAVVAALS